jgi:predicted metalloprotease
MRTRYLIVLVMAVTLAGAGCGDEGRETDVAPTQTTATRGDLPELEHQRVARMPTVRAESAVGALPEPASSALGDPRVSQAAFDSAQAMWEREFEAAGVEYEPADLVFFGSHVQTPCGPAEASTGPFYCPAARTVYLNTGFLDALARTYGLRSGFAAGYITAHEVAHHVQQVLGVHARVAVSNHRDPDGQNDRSIRVELQADCYAGIWLHTVSRRGQLARPDVEDILRAAAVVGDDFRRRVAGAELAPETWTHGSSAQRVHWVSVGLTEGSPSRCNTFSP